MTHRYLAIVIEFEDDDALARFQCARISGTSLVRLRAFLDDSPEDVHVHGKLYRMQPDRHSPYVSPMAVDVHLPTTSRWSDGTGGPNPDGRGPRRNGRRHLSECMQVNYPDADYPCTCDEVPYPDGGG